MLRDICARSKKLFGCSFWHFDIVACVIGSALNRWLIFRTSFRRVTFNQMAFVQLRALVCPRGWFLVELLFLFLKGALKCLFAYDFYFLFLLLSKCFLCVDVIVFALVPDPAFDLKISKCKIAKSSIKY